MPGFEFLRSIFENNQLVVDRKQKLSICKAGTNHSTNRKSPTRKEFVCFVKVFKTSPMKVIVESRKEKLCQKYGWREHVGQLECFGSFIKLVCVLDDKQ